MKEEKYIDWIKQLPCLICSQPSEPHHVPPKHHGAMGMKCEDTRAIPLCHKHHMEYHQYGRDSFAADYSMQYEKVIRRLNEIFKDRQDAIKELTSK